jgi:site-specific DNA-methyltransferase (adenine-specific)
VDYNKIYLRDCLDGLRELKTNSVDIIIADPPYNVGKIFGQTFGNNNDRLTMEEYQYWAKKWIAESMRVIKHTGTIYIYGYTEILARISMLIDVKKQRFLVWHYMNKGFPLAKFWGRSYESILTCWKGKTTPHFNLDDVRDPWPAGKKLHSRWCSGYGKLGRPKVLYTPNPIGTQPRDVLKVNVLAGAGGSKERICYCKTCKRMIQSKERISHVTHKVIVHPTQKPLALTEKLIRAARPRKKDFTTVVLFSGSGSECVAVRNQNGKFIGFETNPDYVLLAQKNLETIMK